MIIPKPQIKAGYGGCKYQYLYPEGSTIPIGIDPFFVIQSWGLTNNYIGDTLQILGYIAVKSGQQWHVEHAEIIHHQRSTPSTVLVCTEYAFRGTVAFPIDPRMTREDIEGATQIYQNDEGTGWLFAHADDGHHHDRELQVESIVSDLFEDILSDILTDVMTSIINGHQKNQQIARLAKHQHTIGFRKDALSYVRNAERTLHIGQHIQDTDPHYLHKMALTAISETKRYWQAEKASEWNAVEFNVDQVITRLTNLHTYETRWDKAARIEAEAKAAAEKAAAEAEATDTSGDTTPA